MYSEQINVRPANVSYKDSVKEGGLSLDQCEEECSTLPGAAYFSGERLSLA